MAQARSGLNAVIAGPGEPSYGFAGVGEPRSPAHWDDRDLISAALSGVPAAMPELVARLLPVVQARVGAALLRWRNQARGRSLQEEARDLVQEVFAALFDQQGRVLRTWDPARGMALKGFVGLVAEREVGMILRTGKRSPFTEDATEQEELEAGAPSRSDGARIESTQLLDVVLERLRQRLSPQGFFIFQLLYVDERSVDEAAALGGLSADAIYAWRSRISRLARQIRDELAGETVAPAGPALERRDP